MASLSKSSSTSCRLSRGSTTESGSVPAVERYARLHRQIEQGRVDDDLLGRLVATCIELDKRDEALRAFERVRDPSRSRGLLRRLEQLGWIEAGPVGVRHAGVVHSEAQPSLKDRYLEALHYLSDGSMPTVAIAGTVAFPLGLALSVVASAIDPSLSVRWLAAVPMLLLVGVIGTIGRRVMLRAMQGLQDADDLPSLRVLGRETPIVLVQLGTVVALWLGPALALSLLGAWGLALVMFAIGLTVMPITLLLLLTSSDWRALHPARLGAALHAAGRPYLHTALAIVPLMLPGVLALALTAHMPLLTILAIIGPLSVAPALMSARILGMFAHRRAACLAGLGLPTATGTPIPASRWNPRA